MSHADEYQRQYDNLRTSQQTRTRQLQEARAAGDATEEARLNRELQTIRRQMNDAEASLALARARENEAK